MLRHTALFQLHKDLGAKTGEFAGYDMPLFYSEGVIKEHEWVRAHAGLFDVSHMGQIMIEGPGAAQLWEKLTPSAFQNKKTGRAQYTVLTNENGGIIDDLIVTRLGEDKFFAVINAGCKDKDIAWIKKHLPGHLKFEYWQDRALIAVQGPQAENVIREVLDMDLGDMPYMHARWAQDMLISRLGYTGEDGFELSIAQGQAAEIWNKLLAHHEVKPIGLAARDSLRLEMGYALYGHDINSETTPLEAGLEWVMSKDNKDFIGADAALKPPEKKRIGVILLEPGVAREGTEIRDMNDKKIGILTSGGHSPSLKKSIGQGYVDAAHASAGTKIFVNVRGKNIAAEICDLPFIAPKTKTMKRKGE
jgi:aminomethyltransferase